jgi:hypothetical protein
MRGIDKVAFRQGYLDGIEGKTPLYTKGSDFSPSLFSYLCGYQEGRKISFYY